MRNAISAGAAEGYGTGMNGPFGGVLARAAPGCEEAIDPTLARALEEAAGEATSADAPALGDGVVLVRYRVEQNRVSYDRDLSAARPWLEHPLSPPDALDGLARVARALAAMHARDVTHGDLRPDVLYCAADGSIALVASPGGARPGALLHARLKLGASRADAVAFAAPEVVVGAECTRASDVYSLAALVFVTIWKYPPLGQVNLDLYNPPLGELSRCVFAALNQVAAARPDAATFASVLTRAALAMRSPGAAVASMPSMPSSQVSPTASSSPLLALLMGVGGLIAAIGAVQLVLKSWDIFGEIGHVVVLVGMALLSAGAGALCRAKNIRAGAVVGASLAMLFASVATAYSFYLVSDWGKLALALVLAPTSWGASALCERKALKAGALIARVSAGLFAMVASGYGLYLLDDRGRVVLWLALSFGVLVAGFARARSGASTFTDSLLTLGTQLLWGAGVQAMILLGVVERSGPFAALSACVAGVTFALALRRGSGLLGSFAALDFAAFAIAFGEYIKTGAPLGPAAYSLAIAAAYAGLSAVATLSKARPVAVPFSVGAAASAIVSAGLGLSLMVSRWETHGAIGAAWPIGVAALALLVALSSSTARSTAVFAVTTILVVAPTAAALLRSELVLTVASVLIGSATLAVALFVERLWTPRGPRSDWLLAGLVSVMAATDLRLWSAITSGTSSWQPLSSTPYWLTMGAASIALLILSFASSARVERTQTRLLEGAAVAQALGSLTLECLQEPSRYDFVALTMATCVLLGVLGVATRRALLLVGASIGLLVNLWLQYFLRLDGVFPRSVLLLGFGVGLLILGVLYDQVASKRIELLREWR
jgi:hypothetical protein